MLLDIVVRVLTISPSLCHRRACPGPTAPPASLRWCARRGACVAAALGRAGLGHTNGHISTAASPAQPSLTLCFTPETVPGSHSGHWAAAVLTRRLEIMRQLLVQTVPRHYSSSSSFRSCYMVQGPVPGSEVSQWRWYACCLPARGCHSFKSSHGGITPLNITYGQSFAKLPVTRSLSHLVTRSFGHSVTLSLCHLVTRSLGHKSLFLYFQRCD